MLSVWAEWFQTSDFSGAPVWSQRAQQSDTILLKAVRSWVVIYNSPVFTSLSMRVYSDIGGSPGQLIATADTTWTLAQITSDPNALMELYFEFVNGLSLQNGDIYHFVLWASGYTGTESSHVAWVRAWPDPFNSGPAVAIETLNRAPFKVAQIGELL